MKFASTHSRSPGFTLLEILVAIAIMGMLAAAVVGMSMNVVGDHPSTPVDFFWEAVHKAEDTALQSGTAVDLSFDERKAAFRVASADAPSATEDSSSSGSDSQESGVLVQVTSALSPRYQFLRQEGLGARETSLVAGNLVETNTIGRVTFYPDGTCTPFRVQIQPQGTEPTIITIDPWTCAEMLKEDKK